MTGPATYRKKPVEVEAMRVPEPDDLEGWGALAGWMIVNRRSDSIEVAGPDGGGVDGLLIHTPEGDMRADIGDWVIRGVQGEFYPCKPDIFEQTYEPASVPADAVVIPRSAIPDDLPGDLLEMAEEVSECRRVLGDHDRLVTAARLLSGGATEGRTCWPEEGT